MALYLSLAQIKRLITVVSRNVVDKDVCSRFQTIRYTHKSYIGLGLIINIIVNRDDRYNFRDRILESFELAYTTPAWLRTLSHYYDYKFGPFECYQAIDNHNKDLARYMISQLGLNKSKTVYKRIMKHCFCLTELISLKDASKPEFCLLAINYNNVEALEFSLSIQKSLKIDELDLKRLGTPMLTYLLSCSKIKLGYKLLTQIAHKYQAIHPTIVKLVKDQFKLISN